MKRLLLRTLFIACAVMALYGLMLYAPMTANADQGGLQTAKIDRDLLTAMQKNPGGKFAVIVSTAPVGKGKPSVHVNADRAKGAADRIKSVGGSKIKGLAIIGGAGATLNADGIAKLSRDPFVSRISPDKSIMAMGTPASSSLYTQVVHAPDVWPQGFTGKGISVAIVDSGIAAVDDVKSRIVASVDLTPNPAPGDPGGHGTHVAGIVGGDGTDSYQARMGIAPGVNLVNVRVIGADGWTSASTVIRGIEWVVQNRKAYNIRVMNLSLGGTSASSYRNDPLAAAVEIAWRAGIVVTVSAGNQGSAPGTIDTPGSDPFVITVGAVDNNQTSYTWDDNVAFFSSRGPTVDGFTKPDLAAPGRQIISLRAPASFLDTNLPFRRVDTNYFRLSGTSMSAPVVAGIAALVLQKNIGLTPDQVKSILTGTASPVPGTSDPNSVGRGMVNAFNAVNSNITSRANRNLRPSDDFCKAVYQILYGTPLVWKDPSYNGINWNNISWDNISWDNISWDNISWDNISWDNISWDNISWDNISWDNISWDASSSSTTANSASWTAISGLD